MTPLIAFVTARLDEDEEIARTAGDGSRARWSYEGDEVFRPDNSPWVTWGRDVDFVTGDSEARMPAVDEVAGEHIARHDPARVLRFVKAVRTIIAVRNGLAAVPASDVFDGYLIETNTYDDTLRAIAATWSDHPDYTEATQ